MHHVAVMKPSWNLIPKIVSGRKSVESRWYKNRAAPWNRIAKGDTVWFKDAGRPVTARAEVREVLQLDHYSEVELKSVLKAHGGCPGICFSNPDSALAWTRSKNYAILIFLENARSVKPFNVDKTGFGNATAWMTVRNIGDVKR